MKIVMLARNAELYTHKRLVEAAQARGHEIDIIDTLRIYMNITSHRPEVRYQGRKLVGYDAVIPRIGASITYFGTAVVRQFEQMDVYTPNTAAGITNSRDKLRSIQILSRHEIGIPATTSHRSPTSLPRPAPSAPTTTATGSVSRSRPKREVPAPASSRRFEISRSRSATRVASRGPLAQTAKKAALTPPARSRGRSTCPVSCSATKSQSGSTSRWVV